MSDRLYRLALVPLLIAVPATASACALTENIGDPVRENGRDRVSVIWTGKGQCQVKGNDESQDRGLHLMPSDESPRTYGPDVCRGGKPVHYILWSSGKLELTYKVAYTITQKTDKRGGGCYLNLTPTDVGWSPVITEYDRVVGCGKLVPGKPYTLEQTAKAGS